MGGRFNTFLPTRTGTPLCIMEGCSHLPAPRPPLHSIRAAVTPSKNNARKTARQERLMSRPQSCTAEKSGYILLDFLRTQCSIELAFLCFPIEELPD